MEAPAEGEPGAGGLPDWFLDIEYALDFGIDPARVEETAEPLWWYRWLDARKARAARQIFEQRRINPEASLTPDQMLLIEWIQSDG